MRRRQRHRSHPLYLKSGDPYTVNHFGMAFVRLIAGWPLAGIRAMGAALGLFLFIFAGARRRVTYTNLTLCFPHLVRAQLHRLAFKSLVHG